MKPLMQSFLREPANPFHPLQKVDFPALRIRLAIPEGWTSQSPYSFRSPNAKASIAIARVHLPGPMDGQNIAARLAESAGWQLLAFRQLGSRDDAETLARQAGEGLLLRVIKIGGIHWSVSAQWTHASGVDTNLLRVCVRSFHGEAQPPTAPPPVLLDIPWNQKLLRVNCPLDWSPIAGASPLCLILRPSSGGPSQIRCRSAQPDPGGYALLNEWRDELEREGFTVYGAPILRHPNGRLLTAQLKAERNGQLFDAPAALSEFAEGSILLSFLAPAWSNAPLTAALTHRAFSDFALAIEEALRRA